LIGASRYQASQQFVEGIWSGCDVGGTGRCGWGTWTVSRAIIDDSFDAGGHETRSWGFHVGGAQAMADNMTVGGAIAYENLVISDQAMTATPPNRGSIIGSERTAITTGRAKAGPAFCLSFQHQAPGRRWFRKE
jgi:hypothetical protein